MRGAAALDTSYGRSEGQLVAKLLALLAGGDSSGPTLGQRQAVVGGRVSRPRNIHS